MKDLALLQTHWIGDGQSYDGSQLRAHWIRRRTGLVGDSMVAFRGSCCVATAEIADLADLLDEQRIAGDDMLHFLWEVFDDGDLVRAVYRQRLLTAQAMELLSEMAAESLLAPLRREGDDLWLGSGKLSISVTSRSLVSTLLHFALNVQNSGTPVTTACLVDLGVEPEQFAQRLLARVADEEASMRAARAQVRGLEESQG